ncbi:MAG TPA: NUDIX hydrolase [Acidimicrobiales bacterium]|nr:NUDIX hydrolase [Acidimicrobiales bacterium]
MHPEAGRAAGARAAEPSADPAGGFRQVGEEEIFGGWLFRVARTHLVDPDGEAFDRDVVRHPGAVAVVPVADDGTVTLVRQFRPALGRSVLEIPAGTCDVDGEPLEETARRELAEEAGLDASGLRRLAAVHNSPGYTDQLTTIFLATGLSPCPTDRSGVEERFMSTETFDLGDLPTLVDDGTLVDETTVLGLWLARHALGPGTA